ncbi:MAG TPA: alpha/beta hydrolase [Thermoanaerobaculia bacterium]|nr:alpha/beta hydrolase [Thermoanaerobaculia bacterium]HUM29643.1 alpha/beta hydrolase [Thermoanaerobaculia bacterium]HXK67294.1 alpha/beta hydrolase [Thermoanaerobaculia bacterium]
MVCQRPSISRLCVPIQILLLTGLVFVSVACTRQTQPSPEPETMITLMQIHGPSGYLTVEDGGTGGVPILFVHGLAGEMTVWEDQLAHVRKSRRALAMDLRDHGQSTPPMDGKYTVDAFASDIHAVLDHLGIRRVVLAGHSLGGAVVIRYAALHPGRVAGLVFVDSVGDLSQLPPEQINAFMDKMNQGDVMENVKKFYDGLLSNASPRVREEVSATIESLEPEAYLEIWQSLLAYDLSSDLNQYSGPMLAFVTPENQETYSLQNLREGIEVYPMEGVSHWVMMEKPEEFNSRLDQFLTAIH